MEKSDVLIVGGGVAGLTVAKFLAEEGVDYILLEEHDDFFKKACGEGVTPVLGDYTFFDLYESKKGIENVAEGSIISTKYGVMEYPLPNIICDKREMEAELARQATKKGGEIRMNTRCEDIAENVAFPQEIKFKICVGADGIHSFIRKKLGIKNPDIGVGMCGITKDIDKERNKCYIEFKKEVIPYGYSWYFPKKDEWNIGIGTTRVKYFKEYSQKFKEMHSNEIKWNGSFLPVSKPLKPYNGNFALVGDAASHVIALLGDGILPSMICAKILADVIIKFARNDYRNVDFSVYEEQLKKEIYKHFLEGYRAYKILSSIWFSEYLFHVFLKMMNRMAKKQISAGADFGTDLNI